MRGKEDSLIETDGHTDPFNTNGRGASMEGGAEYRRNLHSFFDFV